MALIAKDVKKAARHWAKKIYRDGRSGNLNTDDIEAAIESIDSSMDTIISTIPTVWKAKSIKKALLDNLPEPFKSNSTPQEKALAFSTWALKEAGEI